MTKTPEDIISYTKNHRKKVKEILSSQLNPQEKKKYLSSMGIYEERDTNTYMVRVRNLAGISTLEELKKISELADSYSQGQIHFTTRQDIQFHRVSLENTVEVIEKLLELGLFTRGTGGNGVRNIACSIDDGVFDITPFATKSMDYLLQDKDSFYLPRKFKIAFSNCPVAAYEAAN